MKSIIAVLTLVLMTTVSYAATKECTETQHGTKCVTIGEPNGANGPSDAGNGGNTPDPGNDGKPDDGGHDDPGPDDDGGSDTPDVI